MVKSKYHRRLFNMAKKNIISALIEEYDIETADDIQEALKDLLGSTIKSMMESEMDEHLGYENYERSFPGSSAAGGIYPHRNRSQSETDPRCHERMGHELQEANEGLVLNNCNSNGSSFQWENIPVNFRKALCN